VNEAQYAVVGSENRLAGVSGGQDAPRSAHTGIDDGEMDRVLRKVLENLAEDEGAVDDVVRLDHVRHVDDLSHGRALEDGAFHAGDVVIAFAEIGQ